MNFRIVLASMILTACLSENNGDSYAIDDRVRETYGDSNNFHTASQLQLVDIPQVELDTPIPYAETSAIDPPDSNLKRMTFEQIRQAIYDQLGVQWIVDGEDQFIRYQTSLGGVDYRIATERNHQATLMSTINLQKLALDSCRESVLSDLSRSDQRVMKYVDADQTSSLNTEVIQQNLTYLYKHLLSREPTDQEITEDLDLIQSTLNENIEDSELTSGHWSWVIVCFTLVNSAEFLYY